MMDECVGHMTEKVVIPPADKIDIVPRRLSSKKPGEYWPYELNGSLVPDMVRAGVWLNVLFVLLVTAATYLLVPLVFGA